jgi:hypothetical protein
MKPATAAAIDSRLVEGPGNLPESPPLPATLPNANDCRLLLGILDEPRRVGWVRFPSVGATVGPGHAPALGLVP